VISRQAAGLGVQRVKGEGKNKILKRRKLLVQRVLREGDKVISKRARTVWDRGDIKYRRERMSKKQASETNWHDWGDLV